jgi:hypothetical protein
MPTSPRGFVTLFWSCLAGTALLAGCAADTQAPGAEPAGRLNVVLIIADDLA